MQQFKTRFEEFSGVFFSTDRSRGSGSDAIRIMYNFILICHGASFYLHILICNSYTTICPPVRGDNPRALAKSTEPTESNVV